MVSSFDGMWSTILKSMKTYLETEYPTYTITIGPKQEGATKNNSINILQQANQEDPKVHQAWVTDLDVVFTKYANDTTEIDGLDTYEPVLDKLQTHFNSQNVNNLDIYMKWTSVNPRVAPTDRGGYIIRWVAKCRCFRIGPE